MAKSSDPTLKTDKGVYLSQHEATEKYVKSKDLVMVGFRVTRDVQKKIKDYVDSKAEEEKDHLKTLPPEDRKHYPRKYTTSNGRASVNTLLLRLLENEMNEKLAHYE